MKEAIDDLTSPLLARYTHIGIVVGILAGEQTTVLGYGKASEAHPAIPDENTLFEIGSITKVFTALLLASMVEERLVSLDTPVHALLPAYPQLPREMTLLRLATHTSGLPRLPSNFAWSAARKPRNPYANYSPARLHASLSKYKAPPEPENLPSFLYSNLGFGMLGQALGQKLGTSYEQAVIGRICDPLGLSDTRFTLTAEQQQRLATPHTVKGRPTLNWDFATLAGAGALRSTGRDMLRFLAAHLGQFSTPLQPALDLCLKIQVEKPVPQSHLLGIALGWHVSALDEVPTLAYWHNGETGGYRAFLGLLKEWGSGVVVLSNSTWGGESEIDQIGIALLKLLSRTYNKHELEEN